MADAMIDALVGVMIEAAYDERKTPVTREQIRDALFSALRQADCVGWRLMPLSADSSMAGAYLDHLTNPSRSVQSSWRRMAEAAPEVLRATRFKAERAVEEPNNG